MNHITVCIVAKNDRGCFLAAHKDAYCVFQNDTHEIDLGDTLLGPFQGRPTARVQVHNLTRHEIPAVKLDDWNLPLDRAIDHLLSVGQPINVYASSDVIAADSSSAAAQLRSGILGSLGI
jgi:hypothetical protein